jgi:hypothetical protein
MERQPVHVSAVLLHTPLQHSVLTSQLLPEAVQAHWPVLQTPLQQDPDVQLSPWSPHEAVPASSQLGWGEQEARHRTARPIVRMRPKRKTASAIQWMQTSSAAHAGLQTGAFIQAFLVGSQTMFAAHAGEQVVTQIPRSMSQT